MGMAKGHKLATDGTDNHLVLWDLRPHGLTGSKVEKVCEMASISLNRNAVHGDASALSPGGVRVGTPAMTTRGCGAAEFKKIAEFLDRCCQIALKIQSEKGKKLKDFEDGLKDNADVVALKKEVEEWQCLLVIQESSEEPLCHFTCLVSNQCVGACRWVLADGCMGPWRQSEVVGLDPIGPFFLQSWVKLLRCLESITFVLAIFVPCRSCGKQNLRYLS